MHFSSCLNRQQLNNSAILLIVHLSFSLAHSSLGVSMVIGSNPRFSRVMFQHHRLAGGFHSKIAFQTWHIWSNIPHSTRTCSCYNTSIYWRKEITWWIKHLKHYAPYRFYILHVKNQTPFGSMLQSYYANILVSGAFFFVSEQAAIKQFCYLANSSLVFLSCSFVSRRVYGHRFES